MRRVTIAGLLVLPLFVGAAQGIQSYSMAPASTQPPSNSVDALLVSGDSVWVGTSRGLGLTVDGSAWFSYSNLFPFDDKGISAIAVRDGMVWTAIGYSARRDGDFIQTGAGLNWSSDGGGSWTHVDQPVDAGTVDTLLYGSNMIKALAITVPEQNITFDIALTDSAVWIASFAGMLRKSTNRGVSWDRVVLPPDFRDSISPADTLDFDLSPVGGGLGLRENLNHRVFAVHAGSDSVLWVGTAAGINLSTDRGVSWRRFSHQNQAQAISGNFVVALNQQVYQSRKILWAATVNAVGADEQPGISYSSDMGASWSTALLGERAHNFAFNDSIVYVATDRGVFRSDDFGQSWLISGTISDQSTLQRFTSPAIYAVASKGDTLWAGGPEGVAFTIDSPGERFGSSWRIHRRFERISSAGSSYSYPSPFSPDDEVVRIHYALGATGKPVTIRIFDFAMQPVRTLIQNAYRAGSAEYDEIWDGRNDRKEIVANGVYFYRLQLGDDDGGWGKIFVIR